MPAPFGPASPTIARSGIANVQSRSAQRRRCRFPTPCVTSGDVMPLGVRTPPVASSRSPRGCSPRPARPARPPRASARARWRSASWCLTDGAASVLVMNVPRPGRASTRPLALELPIPLRHGIWIDRQIRDDLADGRQLITHVEQAEPKRLLDLLHDLEVRRHARARIEMELDHRRQQYNLAGHFSRPIRSPDAREFAASRHTMRSMSRSWLRQADAADSRHVSIPILLPIAPRPAAAPRGRDRLAAGARAGRVRLPSLDRADPRLAAHLRGARGRDRLPAPARDPVAGERAAHRQRRRLHPPRAGDRARRLVEHARLVDLRGRRRRLAALEVPDPVPRPPRLQPLELRARALLPAARPGAGRPARVLVGADVASGSALALAIIVAGGLAILVRLRLLGIAVGFWVTFAACIAVLAASGHAMTARWHLGPVSDWYFWQVLVFSPEILVFLFFMITDPKTIPAGRAGRRVYAVAIGLLAALLIAPQTTEFGTKVALLAALCARLRSAAAAPAVRRRRAVAWLVRGGSPPGSRPAPPALPRSPVPWRSSACSSSPGSRPARARARRCRRSRPRTTPLAVTFAAGGRASHRSTIDTARRIARDVVADLQVESDALRRRDRERATAGADGARLAAAVAADPSRGGPRDGRPALHASIASHVSLEPGEGQAPPHGRGQSRRDGRADDLRRIAARSGASRLARALRADVRARAQARPLPDHRPRRGAAEAATPPQTRSEALGGVELQRRRRAGRARLPAGRVPLRRPQRARGDDGRRPVLARLRRRRLARPLRRQLLRGRGRRALDGARRAAAQRALPQRARAGSSTSAAARAPTCSSAATAASRPTSTATATPTSTSRPPATTPPPTATTRSCGATATARSRKARARPGSTRRAGTRAPRSAT